MQSRSRSLDFFFLLIYIFAVVKQKGEAKRWSKKVEQKGKAKR